MDRLKKFFKDSKTKKSFKKAGPGRRLADTTTADVESRSGPSVAAGKEQLMSSRSAASNIERIASADVAAQAAYKRMNLGAKQETATQRNIRLKALRELEKERLKESPLAGKELVGEKSDSGTHIIDERTFEHSDAIQNVYFTCELLGDEIKLTKDEMREQIEIFLRSQLDGDSVVVSTLMIFSLNNEKRQMASETLQKYVQNLIEHPEEPKYRRIRMSNKAFQERILPVKGGLEFLLACGFKEKLEEAGDISAPEKFLVISEEKANDFASLVQALEILRAGEPVPLKLYRNPSVFKTETDQKLKKPEFSPDFFQLTVDEIKREQAAKASEVEKLLTLRTKEMRIRDETLRHYTYKYTLIRIRFPDNFYLQGTFSCYEKLFAVREFVLQHLAHFEIPLFVLKDPVSGKLVDSETKTLGELGLAPAALLNFEWDPDVLASYTAQGSQVLYLDDRYMVEARPLS